MFLDEHCRICCKKLRGTKYFIRDYQEIFKLFGVDVSDDDAHVHPEFFCNSCYLTAKRSSLNHPGEPINRVPFQWAPHSDDLCSVCDSKCKGGRPKKKEPSGGRPSALHQHIQLLFLMLLFFPNSICWKTISSRGLKSGELAVV